MRLRNNIPFYLYNTTDGIHHVIDFEVREEIGDKIRLCNEVP